MIKAKDAVVWTNDENHEVRVLKHGVGLNLGPLWSDPIGAHYSQWRDMNNKQRVQLMLETAVDLTMQGFSLRQILAEFAKVEEFHNLGNESFPMCRALTKAIVGKSLEPNTMSFPELLEAYASK